MGYTPQVFIQRHGHKNLKSSGQAKGEKKNHGNKKGRTEFDKEK